jgi:hypothetical protein
MFDGLKHGYGRLSKPGFDTNERFHIFFYFIIFDCSNYQNLQKKNILRCYFADKEFDDCPPKVEKNKKIEYISFDIDLPDNF